MVPENEPLSAFAVYTKQNGTSKNAKKKKKLKARKLEAAVATGREEKKKLLVKKREKIESVMKKKLKEPGTSQKEEVKNLKPKKVKKAKKHKIETKDASPEVKKKKMRNKRPEQDLNIFAEVSQGPCSIHSVDRPGIIQQVSTLRMEKGAAAASTTKRHKNELLNKVKNFALHKKNSFVTGQEILEKILAPLTLDTFMREYWEKAPVYIPSSNASKFSKLISTPMMDEILRENVILFGRDVDVTTYTDGVRETHNPEARAQAHVVWDYYSNGCSVRFLSPQTYSPHLLALNSTLQEYFGSFVGANAYLTPPNSQGFAPHYDDIEAFVLQIEGKKKWKVYNPRNRYEMLPRHSSKNFKPEEVTEPPVLEVTLKAGDVLYFPRGFIHQARTLYNEHSLHVTVSVYQKTSWCDLLEKAVPNALQRAINEDIDFRRGLPINYLKQAGLAYKTCPERKGLIQNLKKLITKLVNYVDIDQAVDDMGTQFMHDALPPVLSIEEASCSVIGNGMRMEENGRLRNRVEVTLETMVRLVRANCSRFVREDVKLEDGTTETQYRLYLSIDNSKEYHQEEPQYLILPEYMVTAMKFLIASYPSFTPINMLPCENEDDKMLLASDLWDRGVLVTETPFDEMNQDETIQTIFNDVSGDENDDSQEGHDENCDVSDIKNILREMVADEELNKGQGGQAEKPPAKKKNKKEKRLDSQTEKTLEISDDEMASNKSDDESQYFLCSEESNCDS